MNFGMLGQGRGSWAVSKNIIMIQLLKSIHIKDNINYRDNNINYRDVVRSWNQFVN